ncbi:MAG: flippase-like domain-containing protein [Muribaculaceae bacterium]|nr:flippase-like domain-containing protein [Muribaculaceae bacterium]
MSDNNNNIPETLTEEVLAEEDLNKKKGSKGIIGMILRWLLPLALTVLMVWYMFRKVHFGEMMDIIRHGVDYWWILCTMGLSMFSHIARALRWRLQLKSLGIRPPVLALCCSIFGCYALNLVFPRLGEVWRCTYIARRQDAPFTKVLGSMVADRLSDAVCVCFLTILTFIVAAPAIDSFLTKYPVGQGILSTVQSPLFWIVIVGCCVGVWALFYFGCNNTAIAKLRKWIIDTWKGFAIITKMEGKWAFLLYSITIWACYFLQLYVAFFAFPFTRDLCTEADLGYGLVPALVAFILSSFGMAIPSNGGLGPWNLAVMFGLAIYGISQPDGTAFSMLVWSGQTVMLIMLGIFTMAYIAIDKKSDKYK